MEKFLKDFENECIAGNNVYNNTNEEEPANSYLQSEKYISDDEETEMQRTFLESTDSDNQTKFETSYLTSDHETLQLINVSNVTTRTSRRRSTRRISFVLSTDDYMDDTDDDYNPVSVRLSSSRRRQNRQTSNFNEPLRPLSTRSEARNARDRISIYNNISDGNESEEEFEAENIVKLEDIPLATESEDDVFISLDNYEKSQKDAFCTICAEVKMINPVSALCCGQFLGCRNCIKLWYFTTNISHLNSRSPLSRGQSHNNHKKCPFCRTEWPEKILVQSVLVL